MARIRTNSTSRSNLNERVTHVALHADRSLHALVVAGNARQLPVTERGVEGARARVFRPQFQPDDEAAGGERGFLQPPDEAPADATAAVQGIHRQQIQVSDLI